MTAVHAFTLHGIEAFPVTFETAPGVEVAGLTPASSKELRVRIKAALAHVGIATSEPRGLKVTSSAPVRGATCDLAAAVAWASSLGKCPSADLERTLFCGELSLAAELRSVRGIVPALRMAQVRGYRQAIIPKASAGDLAHVQLGELDVRIARSLFDVLGHLSGELELERWTAPRDGRVAVTPDLEDVRGQAVGRRVLEIAAAGAHNVLLVGPPGAGKTMLARRLPGILPPLTDDETAEIATIQSAAGLEPKRGRPFRAPHHTVSVAGLIGGGDPIRPGEVTLAHGGVLLLDELPEFSRSTLDALDGALEAGAASVARSGVRCVMPARPLVVAAMNPCPCGWNGDRKRTCSCPKPRVDAYKARVVGSPFLRHFDLIVRLPPLDLGTVYESPPGETSAAVQDRVVRASSARVLEGSAYDRGTVLGQKLTDGARRLLVNASDRRGLSATEGVTTLRVAWTIACLDGATEIREPYIAEALTLRMGL